MRHRKHGTGLMSHLHPWKYLEIMLQFLKIIFKDNYMKSHICLSKKQKNDILLVEGGFWKNQNMKTSFTWLDGTVWDKKVQRLTKSHDHEHVVCATADVEEVGTVTITGSEVEATSGCWVTKRLSRRWVEVFVEINFEIRV